MEYRLIGLVILISFSFICLGILKILLGKIGQSIVKTTFVGGIYLTGISSSKILISLLLITIAMICNTNQRLGILERFSHDIIDKVSEKIKNSNINHRTILIGIGLFLQVAFFITIFSLLLVLLHESEAHYESLMSKLKEISRRLKHTSKVGDDTNRVTHSNHALLEKLNQDKSDLEKEQTANANLIKENKKLLKMVEKDKDASQAEISQLRAEINKQTETNARLAETNAALEKKISGLDGSYKGLRKDYDGLEEKLSKAEAENKKQYDENARRSNKLLKQMDREMDKNDGLQAKIDALQARIDALQAKIARLDAKKTAANSKVRDALITRLQNLKEAEVVRNARLKDKLVSFEIKIIKEKWTELKLLIKHHGENIDITSAFYKLLRVVEEYRADAKGQALRDINNEIFNVKLKLLAIVAKKPNLPFDLSYFPSVPSGLSYFPSVPSGLNLSF